VNSIYFNFLTAAPFVSFLAARPWCAISLRGIPVELANTPYGTFLYLGLFRAVEHGNLFEPNEDIYKKARYLL